jgi:hypothetical protein
MNLEDEELVQDRYIRISNRLKNKLYKPKILHKLYLFLYLDYDVPLYLESIEPLELAILIDQLNIMIQILFPSWNNLNVYIINIEGELLPIIYFLEEEYLNIFYKFVKNKKLCISCEIFDFGEINIKFKKEIIQRTFMFENY